MMNRSHNGGTSLPMTSNMQQPPSASMHAPSASGVNLNVNNLMGNNSCVHTQGQAMNHIEARDITNLIEDAGQTTYFMNRDGCMEMTTAPVDSLPPMLAAGLPPPPPPPTMLGAVPVAPNVINPPGINGLVHDVQLKRQKEIRDMMKKKREKAVLVDRISRWLFPTSFILLNIVYWALFGDHDLW